MQNIPLTGHKRITEIEQFSLSFGKLRFVCVLFLIVGFQMACTSSIEEKTEKSEITSPEETPGKQIVEIKAMKFSPATLIANTGDTVLFVNKDLVPHNVTDRDNQDTLSSQIAPGAEWILIVTKNLHFYCSLHPTMEGEVQLANP